MEGRRHDSTLLRESKLMKYMEERASIFDGFSKNGADGYRSALLKLMSSVREAVEWQFGSMKSLWAFIDFNKSLRLRQSPIGKYMLVNMLLTNCHCCYNGGNQISAFFGLAPPSLDAYLAK
ncbi:hypothetical protein F441_17000 [Phytophthora nicotianae CJ01A1]|uniref:DDE Tnp4 domain-containing protein n=1 Tax=Phytophthora nicotianae CJ01A1 TaxID=1317063 RepID=W2W7Y3_PHYNI|nr:hypothetical protein F441_17000 [Phytophthora nicotianae CJ01A1]